MKKVAKNVKQTKKVAKKVKPHKMAAKKPREIKQAEYGCESEEACNRESKESDDASEGEEGSSNTEEGCEEGGIDCIKRPYRVPKSL